MANKYWVGDGLGTNTWTTAANWSATSGGAGGAGFVSGTDNAIFNGVGVNANGTSTISATIAAAGLDMQPGFTGTLNINATFTITVSVVFGLNCTIGGGAGIVVSGNINMTSNGKIVLGTLSLGTAGTKTLVDDWTVNGITNANLGNVIVNGNRLFMKTGLSNGSNISGTTTLILQGGTWSGAGTVSNNINFDGNVTVSAAFYSTGTITWVSGVFAGTGSISIMGNCTLNTPDTNMAWPSISVSASSTITLLSDIYVWEIFITSTYSVSFIGAGLKCDEFTSSTTGASTLTLGAGFTYTFFHFINISLARVNVVNITSNHASNRANIFMYSEYVPGVDAYFILNTNFTRINATGRTLRTFNGTITDCINVRSITDLATAAATF